MKTAQLVRARADLRSKVVILNVHKISSEDIFGTDPTSVHSRPRIPWPEWIEKIREGHMFLEAVVELFGEFTPKKQRSEHADSHLKDHEKRDPKKWS